MPPKRNRSRGTDEVLASPKPQRCRVNRPRPSAEWVEIPSDEIERAKVPRLRGALRGLDPNAVLTPPATKGVKATSVDGDEDMPALRSSLREGRNVAAIYSSKYHPMDDVTRPKRAEKITGRRLRADLTDEDSDESEPDLGDDDDSDVTIDDDRNVPIGATQHAPDPGATRHSKRSEARKAVIYSAKCHLQDYALPGYRHRHLARPRGDGSKSHKRDPEPVEISSGVEESESDVADEEDDRPEIANSDADPSPMASPDRSPVVPRRSFRSDVPGAARRPHLQNAASDVEAIHAGQHLSGHGYNGEEDDPLHLFQEAEPFQSSGTKSNAVRVAAEILGQPNETSGLNEPAVSSQMQLGKPAVLAIVRPYSTQRPASQVNAESSTHPASQTDSSRLSGDPIGQQPITFQAIDAPADVALSAPAKISSPVRGDETLAAAVPAGAAPEVANVSLLNAIGAVDASSTLPQSGASKAKRASSAAGRTSSTIVGSALSRVASTETLRRSTNGSNGSREDLPPSSHFDDAFHPHSQASAPAEEEGLTLTQIEKSDSSTVDSLQSLDGAYDEDDIPTSAQLRGKETQPAMTKQRAALQPIDGNVQRRGSNVGLFSDEAMSQPAMLKQSQRDSLAVKKFLMDSFTDG